MPALQTFPFDVAISAVRYDAVLVAELTERLAPRLSARPVWAGHASDDGPGTPSVLSPNVSRLAIVLHQRLWAHDLMTRSDDAALRRRIHVAPDSTCIVTLDNTELSEGLRHLPTCDLRTAGIDEVIAFACASLTASGGRTNPVGAMGVDAPEPEGRWGEAPTPFLRQTRAASMLRRELDDLAVQARGQSWVADGVPADVAVQVTPTRLVARAGEVALSFSWVADRSGSVADGRLLVMAWTGANGDGRGSLRHASMTRECVYRVESRGPDEWRWRADEINGRGYSTADLVGDWCAALALAQTP
jgi:hypothetical protein